MHSNRPPSPLAGFRRRVLDWWHRQAQLRQLSQLDEHELDRVLQDLKVTGPELRDAIASGDGSDLLLPEMLDALGLERGSVEARYPPVASDLKRVCAQCPDKKQCRHELEAGTAAANFHAFCYNASTLEALLAEAVRDVARDEGRDGQPPSAGGNDKG